MQKPSLEQLAATTKDALNALQDGPQVYQGDIAVQRQKILARFLQRIAPDVAEAYAAVPDRFPSWAEEPIFEGSWRTLYWDEKPEE